MLYNADCYDILKQMKSKSVDLVVIDPPYEIGKSDGGPCGLGGNKKYRSELINLDICSGFDFKILDELCRVLKKINIYIWCNAAQIPKYFEYFKDKTNSFNIISWHKSNPIPTYMNHYLPDTEYCLFFREDGVHTYGNYNTLKTYYVSSINKKDKDLYGHPTIKPLNIIENLVINSSKENEVVLDCFMGSGTTGVACKKLNREFIGIEINKDYFNIAKKRIESIDNNVALDDDVF